MSLASPAYAWLLLLLVPVLMAWHRAGVNRRRDLLLLAGEQAETYLQRRRLLRTALLTGAALLIIVALCRPQWGKVSVAQQSRGLEILVALDVSRSMLADDLHPSRLTAAKQAVAQLLPRLQGDRIGLIAFSGSAFLVCPLTSDYDTFLSVLMEADSRTIPLGGTSLAAALNEARRAFGGAGPGTKLLIVLSDGEDHGSGDPAVAAAALAATGSTIHSIAIGTESGSLIPLPAGDYLKDRQGAAVKTRLQPVSLQKLAMTGKGRFLELAREPHGLEELYLSSAVAGVGQPQHGSRQLRREGFQYPLGLALLLLLIEICLPLGVRP